MHSFIESFPLARTHCGWVN